MTLSAYKKHGLKATIMRMNKAVTIDIKFPPILFMRTAVDEEKELPFTMTLKSLHMLLT